MLAISAAVLLLVGSLPHDGAAAQAPLGACLQRVGGGTEKEFLAFDRELRAAVSAPDAALVTLLASYPLRINDTDGTTWIENAATLAARFDATLPAALRSAVTGMPVASVICTATGIGYGQGALWVKVTPQFGVDRFAIGTINLPSPPKTPRPGIAFVCRADDYRIIVDRPTATTLRYRSWNRPRAVTDKPDLEIASGTEDYSGSGACAHRSWTFTSGTAEYDVSELGCTADTPPSGASGELNVSVGGAHKKQSWCY